MHEQRPRLSPAASPKPFTGLRRFRDVPQDALHTLAEIESLLDRAARARRLAAAFRHDPAAIQLKQLAEQIEAEVERRVRLG